MMSDFKQAQELYWLKQKAEQEFEAIDDSSLFSFAVFFEGFRRGYAEGKLASYKEKEQEDNEILNRP